MALFQEDDSFFSVTVERGNHVEFSITQADSPIYSVWMTLEQHGDKFVGKDHSLLIDDGDFIDAVYTFGQQQVQSGNATVGNIEFIPYNESTPVPYSADLAAITELLEDIHGEEYVMEDWTGLGDEEKYGLTFSYLETLDFSIVRQGAYVIAKGMSLGASAAGFAAKFPTPYQTALRGLSYVLRISSVATTIIQAQATVDHYSCDATYGRDVLIDGAGPYWHSAHQYVYSAMVNMEDTSRPYLEETEPDVYYPDPQRIFDSYVIQREQAYENYQNQ